MGLTFAFTVLLCTSGPSLAQNPAAHLVHTWRSTRPGDRAGTAVACVGDVDGDGLDDWASGAPRAGLPAGEPGSVRVFSGRDGRGLHVWNGPTPGGWFGAAVAGAGDVDLDGRPDILVGAPYAGAGHGVVWLYSGRTGEVLRTWSGESPGDQWGRSVAGVGDVNGDGVADLLIGAPQEDGGGTSSGLAVVLSGADGARLHEFRGSAWDQLGRSVASLGDLNGDGHGDFGIGVPFADGGAFNGGKLLVTSGIDGSSLFQCLGVGAGDQLGFAVAGGVDIDGDGVPDVVVAAPGEDARGVDSGAAHVLSGADGHELFRLPGPQEATFLSAVALLGDIDGDGRGEVLTGIAGVSPASQQVGLVRLHSGTTLALLLSLRGPEAWGWFGASLATGGDVTGDGLPEFLVGAPGHDDHVGVHGSARLYSPVAP